MTLVIVSGSQSVDFLLGRFPSARVLSATQQPVWHVDKGCLWIKSSERVEEVPFEQLLILGEAPRLCVLLGCVMDDSGVVTDSNHQTSVPGIFFLFQLPDQASMDRLADAIAGNVPSCVEGARPVVRTGGLRLAPLAIAVLLEEPPTPERDQKLREQEMMIGSVAFFAPVGLAALAAIGDERPAPYPVQREPFAA